MPFAFFFGNFKNNAFRVRETRAVILRLIINLFNTEVSEYIGQYNIFLFWLAKK